MVEGVNKVKPSISWQTFGSCVIHPDVPLQWLVVNMTDTAAMSRMKEADGVVWRCICGGTLWTRDPGVVAATEVFFVKQEVLELMSDGGEGGEDVWSDGGMME